ncbi:MAG: O-antigen ligase family protein [Alphaproteobacteria bacterium]|nr:O-antigen ligase family protein [Alphaproteobacteria bacterium]
MAVSGYPVIGLISTFLGITDDSISVPFRIFVVALAMVAFLQGKVRGGIRPVDGWLAFFFVIYMFRLLWDAFVMEVTGADSALLAFSVTVLVPVIVLALTANAWNDRNVAMCFVVVGTIVSAGGIWLSQSGIVDITYFEETGRLGFTKINPISLGHVGVTTVLASIVLFVRSSSNSSKGFALACAGISLAMIYFAASRGPVVAFIASIIAYILFSGRWKYAIFAFVVIYVSILVLSTINIYTLLEHLRLTSIITNRDTSAVARLEVYDEAFEAFKQYPIFGRSFALPVSGGWVHNIFLESAMALGVIGLATIIIVIIRSFVSSIRAFRSGNTMAAFLFLQFVVAAQFSGALWGWPGLWIGVALVNAGRRKRGRVRQVPRPVMRVAAHASGHIGRTNRSF